MLFRHATIMLATLALAVTATPAISQAIDAPDAMVFTFGQSSHAKDEPTKPETPKHADKADKHSQAELPPIPGPDKVAEAVRKKVPAKPPADVAKDKTRDVPDAKLKGDAQAVYDKMLAKVKNASDAADSQGSDADSDSYDVRMDELQASLKRMKKSMDGINKRIEALTKRKLKPSDSE